MRNIGFEIAFFKHLYSSYKLDQAEEYLQRHKIEPLLSQDTPVAAISKYFRLMNPIDYTKLSFSDKRYIRKIFSNTASDQTAYLDKTILEIFHKVKNNISTMQKGYTLYHYDGSAHDGDNIPDHYIMSENIAPNNYITFGLYYKQFGENTEIDEFRNHNIVADIANSLQENNIAVVCFSEVDIYQEQTVRL